MNEEHVSRIRITKRLLRIGSQSYPLANIARVQTFWIEWGRKIITGSELTALLIALAGVIFVLPVLGEGDTAVALFFLLVFLVAGVAIYRVLSRQRRFLLTVESNGPPMAVLAGKTDKELRNLAEEIVGALENPPDTERIFQLQGDIILGDKVQGDKVGRDKNVNAT